MATRTNTAIVVAAGQGLRMGTDTPKQFLELDGAPVLLHALRAFAKAYADMELIVVLPEAWMHMEPLMRSALGAGVRLRAVSGGASRFDSVSRGLALLKDPSVVFVHDGARPLPSVELIRRCREEALLHGSAIPVIPLKESLRLVENDGSRALDRSRYRLVQTPQTFVSEWLKEAFCQPYRELFTDEASVVEHKGYSLHLVEGEEQNLKITTPLDLLIAGEILRRRIASQK